MKLSQGATFQPVIVELETPEEVKYFVGLLEAAKSAIGTEVPSKIYRMADDIEHTIFEIANGV